MNSETSETLVSTLSCDMSMLSKKEIESYLDQTNHELRDITLELRNIIAEIAPDATEVMHSRGMTYYHTGRGGPVSAGICQIIIERDHIRLAFIHGSFLPEPRGLFEGSSKYKRYIRIYSYEDAPWDYLKDLTTASSRFDPYTLSMK
jgi:hypothetical protein